MCGGGEGGQGWAGCRNVGGTGWLRPARLGARAPYPPLGPSASLMAGWRGELRCVTWEQDRFETLDIPGSEGEGNWRLRLLGPGGVGGWAWTPGPRSWQIGPFSSETALSPPPGWHPGISSQFLEPPFPSPPSLVQPCPWGPTICGACARGLDSRRPTSGPRPVPGEGAWGQAGAWGWVSAAESKDRQRDPPLLPSPSRLRPLRCQPPGPPPSHRHTGVWIIWGPGRGTVTRKHCVPLSLPRASTPARP